MKKKVDPRYEGDPQMNFCEFQLVLGIYNLTNNSLISFN